MSVVPTAATYTPRRGFHISREDAQIIGPEIERVAAKVDQKLDPIHVVAAARPDDAPLHPYFEWDDGLAAEAHRLNQGRLLMRAVQITYLHRGDPAKPRELRAIPAFHHVNTGTEDKPEMHYMHINVIRKQPSLLQQIVTNARKELEGWRGRYEEYSIIAGFGLSYDRVVEAIANLSATELDESTEP